MLADSVPFRMHWPLQADLSLNSRSYRVTARGGTAKLGANQRDEAANVSAAARAPLAAATGRLPPQQTGHAWPPPAPGASGPMCGVLLLLPALVAPKHTT
jgi:hypothetical protein